MALHSQPGKGVLGAQKGGYNRQRFWQLYLRPASTSSSWMLSFPTAKRLSIFYNCTYSLSFFLDYCTKPLWWPSLDLTMILLKTAHWLGAFLRITFFKPIGQTCVGRCGIFNKSHGIYPFGIILPKFHCQHFNPYLVKLISVKLRSSAT